MITAGYRVAEYEEVDIRAIFEAMINTQDARTELIKAGWCPPGGPGNSTTTNVVKTCMNCGTSGCDQKDTRVCASSGCHSLWTPETPNDLGNRRAAFGASVLTDGLAGKTVTTE